MILSLQLNVVVARAFEGVQANNEMWMACDWFGPQFVPYLIPPTVEDRAQLQRVETDEDEEGSANQSGDLGGAA